MPLVKVEIFKGKSPEYKKALLNGIHRALVKILKIPENDRTQRLYELDKENFEIVPTRSKEYSLIEITMIKGRSNETKKRLYKAIVENLADDPNIDDNDLTIVIFEPPLENWGIRGGKPASEVELGFKIDV